jgi:hypothetical protein
VTAPTVLSCIRATRRLSNSGATEDLSRPHHSVPSSRFGGGAADDDTEVVDAPGEATRTTQGAKIDGDPVLPHDCMAFATSDRAISDGVAMNVDPVGTTERSAQGAASDNLAVYNLCTFTQMGSYRKRREPLLYRAPGVGLEPTTNGLTVRCSAN